jgi:hypothetical protein
MVCIWVVFRLRLGKLIFWGDVKAPLAAKEDVFVLDT